MIKIDVNVPHLKLISTEDLMMASSGLEGVVVADTVLSEVDGEAGRLVLRGRMLEELAGHSSFEAVLDLLLEGFLEPHGGVLKQALGPARVAAYAMLPAPDPSLQALSPTEELRVLLARVSDGEDFEAAARLIAAPAVFTAALLRRRAAREAIAPDPSVGHAADFLRMLRGSAAPAGEAAALDRYLVTVIDHGLNASTFAARVVVSTRAGLTSAVVAALSALKGPLHGGAPGPVLDMLDAIGSPESAAPWIEQALHKGQRLMGFGHRIYRVRDPRADSLKAALRQLTAAAGGPGERLVLAEAVERAALEALRREKPGRRLATNVEFYTALLLEALGISREAFTCIFAMGRVGGWIAHAREQALTGRLIRPASRYVGLQPCAEHALA
jgi:citrate synthase